MELNEDYNSSLGDNHIATNAETYSCNIRDGFE